MSSNIYTAGLNNVGSFQVSGMPYASSSVTLAGPEATRITFPYVTSWVKIINTHGSNNIVVSFSSASAPAGSNYQFTILNQTSTEPLPWKITELYVTGSATGTTFDVIAGLTNIPIERVNNISKAVYGDGTNWTGSVGVG